MSAVRYIVVDRTASCLTSVPRREVMLVRDDETCERAYVRLAEMRKLLAEHPGARLVDTDDFEKIHKNKP